MKSACKILLDGATTITITTTKTTTTTTTNKQTNKQNKPKNYDSISQNKV